MPHHPIPQKNRSFARSMRREPTESEDRMWGALRGRRLDRIKFRRQAPVGFYIADFVCAEAMLIVEIDGSQHAELPAKQRDGEAALSAVRCAAVEFEAVQISACSGELTLPKLLHGFLAGAPIHLLCRSQAAAYPFPSPLPGIARLLDWSRVRSECCMGSSARAPMFFALE